MLKLGLLSLLDRRVTLALTVASIALSVAMILGIERLRSEARDGFTDTVSGIDLIVAARGNHVQILMATVFGVGSTSNTISGATYGRLATLPEVAWAVPLAHGDNHLGYPVVGTTAAYFDRYRYAGDVPLAFASGRPFASAQEAVVGAEVARQVGYAVGTQIVNAHGAGDVAFDVHDEAPFLVTGILQRTGTPVDRMVFVSLDGFAAIHAETRAAALAAGPLGRAPARPGGETRSGAPEHGPSGHDGHGDAHRDGPTHGGAAQPHEEAHGQAGALGRLNAVYLGLKSRNSVLSLQRFVAEYPHEPLSALLPAVTLLELWSLTAVAENSLRLVALAVVVAGMLGMLTMLSATLEARRREFAILRSVGAAPRHVFALIVFEAAAITSAGLVCGVGLFYIAVLVADPWLAAHFGLRMGLAAPSVREWGVLLLVGAFGLLASLFPAYRVYRHTLADGLTLRI